VINNKTYCQSLSSKDSHNITQHASNKNTEFIMASARDNQERESDIGYIFRVSGPRK